MRRYNRALGGTLATLALLAGMGMPALAQGDIDFGDDSSQWANDGECDDSRFTGEGMAVELENEDVAADATDCKALFDAGKITVADEGDGEIRPLPPEEATATGTGDIDFGDDSSEWAKDEECDDPRFSGTGMAGTLEDLNIRKDATDCRAAFEAGTVTLIEGDAQTPVQTGDAPASTVSNDMLARLAERINFGDDSGDFPEDDECDDPDFVGSGMAFEPQDGDRMGDATDCRAAFLAGTVTLKGTASASSAAPVAFDYGSDYSQWANDGECDDWRFTGDAMSKKLFSEDVQGDATDCRALEDEGRISIKPVYQPEYAANAPYDAASVEFGDDSSSYANDSICDDPRFEGPGMASTVFESDRLADATDCRAAYEAGTIMLKDGQG